MDASGGNDGRITGYFGFHTELEQDPWWMVDLGAQLPLREIVVYNRLDDEVVAARAAHLRLSLSDDGSSWHEVYARREDAPFGGADGAPLRVPLYGRRARYVRVSVPGHTILHLDEVEIY